MLAQSFDLRRVLQISLVMIGKKRALYYFIAQACLQYLGIWQFLFLQFLVMEVLGKVC